MGHSASYPCSPTKPRDELGHSNYRITFAPAFGNDKTIQIVDEPKFSPIHNSVWICAETVHKFAAASGYFRSGILLDNIENTRQTKTFNMKKTVLFAAALFTVAAATAQTGEITSAKGENWLSQDGDWGLTFDAAPILNYAGNLFNGNTGNGGVATNALSYPLFAGFPQGVNGNTVIIGGKKLIDANTAYRGKLRIGIGSTKNTDIVDDVTNTDPLITVENTSKIGFMAVNIGAGLEKRVGSTRVVGVYGAELNVGFGSSKTKNEFGNAVAANNPVSNTTEIKNGGVFGLGLNAFAGVEWFCAPKLSLSGEYMWGVMLTSVGTPETTVESFDPTAGGGAGAVVTTTTTGNSQTGNVDKTSTFSLDTGVSGASIGLNFYFQ